TDPQGGAEGRVRRQRHRRHGPGRPERIRWRGQDRDSGGYRRGVPLRALPLVLAGAGLFVAALDAYVVVTLLPAMVADIGLTIDRFEQATPIVTGCLGGYVVAMPLLGAYSDTRGRAPVFAICMAAFALGSVVTATAGLMSLAGLPWLVAGSFLQGPGGGGLGPLTLALCGDLDRGSPLPVSP